MWARREEKNSVTDILNDKQICGCLNQSLGSTYIFFSPIVDKCDKCVCRGDIWPGSPIGLCNVSVWCVCLQGL